VAGAALTRARLGALLACLVALPVGGAAGAQDAAVEEARTLLARGDAVGARAALRTPAQGGSVQAQGMLAAMLLDGVGGRADRARAMQWLCMLVHHRHGGASVARAAWFLAEYFRTGGGLPGRRYNEGERQREDPVKAYFWFRVMAEQAGLFETAVEDAVNMGRLGGSSVARQLLEGERQRVDRRLERWSPGQVPASPERCLELPDG